MAQDGASVYHSHCSSCHDIGVGRAPLLEGFRRVAPESVQSALMQGVMVRQGLQLNLAEIRAVATYVTGKKFAPEAPERNLCTSTPPSFDFALDGPRWNGWGVDGTNQRSQSAAMARLSVDQVPRLKVRWAFGFDGALRAGSQPTVAGGRVFVAGTNNRVFSLDAATGCVRWAFPTDAGVRTAVSIGRIAADWAVYFGDIGGSVYAVNAVTGKQIWKTQVEDFPGASITGAPTLYGSTLYVPVSSMEELLAGDQKYECCRFRGSISAVDAITGKVMWKTYTIPDAAHRTHKNSAGVQMWGPSGAPVISSPTIDPIGRAIYVTTGDSYSDPAANTTDSFIALSMDTGKMLWSSQTTVNDTFNNACVMKDSANCPDTIGPDADFLSPPMLTSLPNGSRALIAGQKSGVVHAVDPDQSGKILWQTRIGDGYVGWGGAADDRAAYIAYSGMKWDRNRVLDLDAGGGLFALDLATGKMLWFAPPGICGIQPGCSPAQSAAVTLIPGVVFSGSLDGHLRAYSTSNGQRIVDFDTVKSFKTVNGVTAHGGSLDGPGPVVVDSMVFVNSGYGLAGGRPGNVLLAFSVDGK